MAYKYIQIQDSKLKFNVEWISCVLGPDEEYWQFETGVLHRQTKWIGSEGNMQQQFPENSHVPQYLRRQLSKGSLRDGVA